MQTTANLWDVLCRDLEEQRTLSPREQHRAAADKFREAAAQVFRTNSPRLADALEISGDVCQASGFLDDAVRDFEESLARHRDRGDASGSARVAAKLALLVDYQGKDQVARELYSKALTFYEDAHDHSQHCMLLSNLAALERRTGHLDRALACYSEAIELSARIYNEVHPEVALACNNMGVAQTEAGDWLAAENVHMRALGIREKLYGAMHPEVAQSLSNLAVLYHSSGNFDKADSFYRAALKTYAAFVPESDSHVVNVRSNYEALQALRK